MRSGRGLDGHDCRCIAGDVLGLGHDGANPREADKVAPLHGGGEVAKVEMCTEGRRNYLSPLMP